MHTELHVITTGNATDLELQSEDQKIADSPAESGRACCLPLNNATIQRREPLDFFDAIREEETRIAGAPAD